MRRRRGSLFMEVSVSLALMLVVMVAISQLLAVVATQRRATNQRFLALRETANIMERVSTLEWDNLTDEGLGELELSNEARQGLVEPRLSIAVSDEEEPRAKQVRVELSWLDRAGQRGQPVQLVAWRHP